MQLSTQTEAISPTDMPPERLGSRFECKQGELICQPGDPCDALYFVKQGSIECWQVGPQGLQQEMSAGTLCGAGQFFGELDLGAERPSPWLALAREDSVLLRIERARLTRLLRQRCGRAELKIHTLLGYQDQLIFLCA